MTEDSPSVVHDEAAHRYEVRLGGATVGHATYRRVGTTTSIDHTETDPGFSGRGLAGRLIEAMLDDIRAADGTVVPACSYAAHWIRTHPAYQDLLAPAVPGASGAGGAPGSSGPGVVPKG